MMCQEKLKQLRLDRNLTQEELARETLIPRQLISNYENGSLVPSKKDLEKLATFFGVSLEEILPSIEEVGMSMDLKEKSNNKEVTIRIVSIIGSILVAIMYFLPLRYGRKQYSTPFGNNFYILGYYFSIKDSCLYSNNYIFIVSIIVIAINTIILVLSLVLKDKKVRYILKICFYCVLAISIILMIATFIYGNIASYNPDLI